MPYENPLLFGVYIIISISIAISLLGELFSEFCLKLIYSSLLFCENRFSIFLKVKKDG